MFVGVALIVVVGVADRFVRSVVLQPAAATLRYMMTASAEKHSTGATGDDVIIQNNDHDADIGSDIVSSIKSSSEYKERRKRANNQLNQK